MKYLGSEEERAAIPYKMAVLGMPASEVDRFLEQYLVITSPAIRADGKVIIEDAPSFTYYICGLVSLTEPEGPFMEATDPQTGLVVGFIQMWRVRVSFGDMETYGEMTWRPGTEVFIGTHGPVSVYHKEEPIARHGLRLFARMAMLGRPRGSGSISGPDEVIDAFASFRAEYGRKPTQEQLAVHMGYSDPSTLKRYLRDNRHRLQWKSLR